jgi:hypothetical protein
MFKRSNSIDPRLLEFSPRSLSSQPSGDVAAARAWLGKEMAVVAVVET